MKRQLCFFGLTLFLLTGCEEDRFEFRNTDVIPSQDQCTTDTECPTRGEVCEGVATTAESAGEARSCRVLMCDSARDCNSGLNQGRGCLLDTSPGQCVAQECTIDNNCEGDLNCVEGACTTRDDIECTDNSGCIATNQVCDANRCVDPPEVCMSDQDCVFGRYCRVTEIEDCNDIPAVCEIRECITGNNPNDGSPPVGGMPLPPFP